MADPASPALQGIRVVERTTGAAGQIAGMLLADLGADVVRVGRSSSVEPADLPGWLCWNRGKRIVDVGDDAALERLLLRADVLVLDATPTERAGSRLDADSLRLRAPALVDVWMPPIGTSGRWSELPHDQLLLDAIGGFAAHHPATEERPVAAVVPGRHAAQGALGAVAALSGLIGRIRDGWGRSATVTGLHAEAAILNTVMARSADGLPMLSVGKLLPGPPSYRLYAGADGRWLFLAALTPELFIKALDVLERMDVLVHPDVGGDFLNILQPDVGAMVGAELEATFATSSTDDWLERFAAADVPAAPVGDPAGWLQGDVLGYACPPVTHERRDLGPVVMPGLPVTLAANPGVPGAPPEQATGEPSGGVWIDVAELPRPTGDAPGADDRPLSGLRVVDFSTFLAAPFVGTLMALHGADVVKVEAPTGDPYAVYSAPYALINEHKPRMTADLASDEGRATLLELAGVADVVVDNLVASSLARRKLTPDRFEAANPVLVRCSVTAYGAEGPFAEHPGFDPIMQSVSGLASVQGGDGRPVASTAPMLDIAAGCVGALGTLAALWARHQSGQGQRVFTSLAAVSAFVQSAELTTYDGRPPRPVGGPDFAGPSLWRRLYKAADRWFAVAAATDEQRDAFLDVVGQSGPPATEDDAQIDTISRTIEQRPCDEWLDLLDAAGVPACAAINRFEMDHPFLVEHRYSHIVDTPHVGRLEIVGGYTDWHHIDRLPPLPVDELRADVAAVLARWSTDAKA